MNTIDLNGFTIPIPTMLSALLAVVLVVITMPRLLDPRRQTDRCHHVCPKNIINNTRCRRVVDAEAGGSS